MPNFSSLELNELRQSSLSLLLRVAGWVGGRVGGLSETGNKAIFAAIEIEVELS